VIPAFAPEIGIVVLRGLPGSGKSTFAQLLEQTQGFKHLEADRFMTDAQGKYRFDPARAADAHAVCQQHAYEALRTGARVVVANTHVRLWEFAPYLGLAQLFRREVRVVECLGAWDNIHGVSSEIIAKMREKWEPLPPHLAQQALNYSP
jgi:predicted kinase